MKQNVLKSTKYRNNFERNGMFIFMPMKYIKSKIKYWLSKALNIPIILVVKNILKIILIYLI